MRCTLKSPPHRDRLKDASAGVLSALNANGPQTLWAAWSVKPPAPPDRQWPPPQGRDAAQAPARWLPGPCSRMWALGPFHAPRGGSIAEWAAYFQGCGCGTTAAARWLTGQVKGRDSAPALDDLRRITRLRCRPMPLVVSAGAHAPLAATVGIASRPRVRWIRTDRTGWPRPCRSGCRQSSCRSARPGRWFCRSRGGRHRRSWWDLVKVYSCE